MANNFCQLRRPKSQKPQPLNRPVQGLPSWKCQTRPLAVLPLPPKEALRPGDDGQAADQPGKDFVLSQENAP
jgi:hypothetical protein